MSQPKLTYSLGDNIDQELLIGDHLSCFLEKLSRHITQGSDDGGRFRRELKNNRRAACESGRSEWSEHRGKKTNSDCAGGQGGVSTDLLTQPEDFSRADVSRQLAGA